MTEQTDQPRLDPDRWLEIAGELADGYPGQPFPPATATIWYADLAHLDADQVLAAVRRHRRDTTPDPRTGRPRGTFLPAVAEILAAAEANDADAEAARLAADPHAMSRGMAERVEATKKMLAERAARGELPPVERRIGHSVEGAGGRR